MTARRAVKEMIMAMSDAMGFLTQCRISSNFRKRLYGESGDARGFVGQIAGTGYRFSDAEIADALRALQLRARDEFEADEIRELGQWYRFMKGEDASVSGGSPRPTDGAVPPLDGCSPAQCSSCSLCR